MITSFFPSLIAFILKFSWYYPSNENIDLFFLCASIFVWVPPNPILIVKKVLLSQIIVLFCIYRSTTLQSQIYFKEALRMKILETRTWPEYAFSMCSSHSFAYHSPPLEMDFPSNPNLHKTVAGYVKMLLLFALHHLFPIWIFLHPSSPSICLSHGMNNFIFNDISLSNWLKKKNCFCQRVYKSNSIWPL